MAYVSNFKKFIKGEEKKATEAGANPQIEEQTAPAAPGAGDNIGGTSTDTSAAQTATTPPTTVSVEASPAVIAARQAVSTAMANRDKVIAAKQAELDKLKADQDVLVNTANTNLNKALQDAGKAATTTT